MYNTYISENGNCNVGCDFCDKELNLVADLKDPIDSLEKEIIKNSWKIIWQDLKGENTEGDRHICDSCFNGFKLSESEFMKLKENFYYEKF